MECVDIWKNTSGEGGCLVCNWRWGSKAWVANRIRYPGSPCRKRWVLGVGGFPPFSAGANALSTPPGEYDRKVETQRNWRGPHKRWSMWFNSKLREEPYQVLTSCANLRDKAFPSGTQWQVVHGRRQLVSWDVGLSPATSATLVTLLVASIKLGTLVRLPVTNRRKVGTTSDHHAPYDLGYTRATMDGTTSRKLARVS